MLQFTGYRLGRLSAIFGRLSHIKIQSILKLMAMLLWAGSLLWWAFGIPATIGPLGLQVALAEETEGYVGSDKCATCHKTVTARFAETAHAKLLKSSSWEGKVVGCESCHGPGREHVESGGEKDKIRSFALMTSKQASESCLTCHDGREEHINFRRGEHWRNDVGCTDCHSPHGPLPGESHAGSITLISRASKTKADSSILKMLRESQPDLCVRCHTEVKSQFHMPFHHKVLEGAMRCTDCHNPHGGFEPKQTRHSLGTEMICLKCHTDKQGPFVFEHAPAKMEGCTACHVPHGSSNAMLLKRPAVRQLCLECHSNAHRTGIPNTPGNHNQAVTRFQNCTTCHTRIHGSQNHPYFFR
jgi:DmsE family decaheme c-type cytochrome